MTADLELARRVLAAQPFSELLGARITTFEPGRAELELDITHAHRQQFGLVHGGVLAYAADNALTFAAGSVLGESVVTTSLALNYLNGARHGRLRARAEVDYADQRRAVCTARVEVITPTGDKILCALGYGTVAVTSTGARPI